MFCPYCGTESTQGLKYCKRCGGSLAPPAQEQRPAVQSGTAWAVGTTMTLLVIAGLAIVVALATELAHSSTPPGTFALIVAASSATLLGIVYVVTRFWMHLLGVARGAAVETPAQPRAPQTSELGPAPQRALPDAPIPSITEQTTRTLEHAKKR